MIREIMNTHILQQQQQEEAERERKEKKEENTNVKAREYIFLFLFRDYVACCRQGQPAFVVQYA